MGIKRTASSRQMDLGLQNQQFLSILKHKKQKTKSIHFPLYFWADPFVNLNSNFWNWCFFQSDWIAYFLNQHKKSFVLIYDTHMKFWTPYKWGTLLNMACRYHNPISHGVFDCDNIIGGVLKTYSQKPDLVLSEHHDNHTM